MHLQASINRHSALYQQWLKESRVAGEVNGVRFVKHAWDYISVENPLSRDSVIALLDMDDDTVRLELSSMPPADAPDERDHGVWR